MDCEACATFEQWFVTSYIWLRSERSISNTVFELPRLLGCQEGVAVVHLALHFFGYGFGLLVRSTRSQAVYVVALVAGRLNPAMDSGSLIR